ncbi:MAG: D-2-hydroxyacid dehydrogenase [Anaerolineales bacterium]|nr:D-2-hydroxyacid dehydrogenase [Anaerolineales bacterium]
MFASPSCNPRNIISTIVARQRSIPHWPDPVLKWSHRSKTSLPANQTVRVLITHPFPDELAQPLHAVSPRLRISHYPAKDADELADHWPQVEVLYTSTVMPRTEQAPRLRWIQSHWTGVEHLLQHPIAARARLTTVSGIGAVPIAEYVFSGLLAFTHHLPRFLFHQARNEWPSGRWEKFVPVELRSATLGIVGYDSLGREIARLARAFGMRTLATKRNAAHSANDGWRLPGGDDADGSQVEHIFAPDAMHAMLPLCDHVVVTVPLTPSTRQMIGAAEFAAMKAGTIFVNVARGKVMDEAALIAAHQGGHLGGALLDVFETEPLAASSPLWQLPNVIISPHVAGFTPHYDERALQVFAENLCRYVSNQPLLNQVDVQRGY